MTKIQKQHQARYGKHRNKINKPKISSAMCTNTDFPPATITSQYLSNCGWLEVLAQNIGLDLSDCSLAEFAVMLS